MTTDTVDKVGRQRAAPAPGGYGVRAVARTLDILDALAKAPEGLSLAEVAREAQLPRSSVFRYLTILQARRYVARDPQSARFRLGLALSPFGRPPLTGLVAHTRPWLEKLRDEFEETANLAVLDEGRVMYLEVLESPKAMRLAARRGDRDCLHSTAVGKAIASQLDEGEVRRILESEGMPRLTAATITDADTYLKARADVRARGYATDWGENEEGAWCVSVPIALPSPSLRAAISISAPASRLAERDVETIAGRLRHAAIEISAALGGG